jgi:hypothetical protein
MPDDEILVVAEEFVDRASGIRAAVNAVGDEVAVACRGVDEDRARSECSEKFGEVVRNFGQAASVVGQARHVPNLAPAFAEEPDSLGTAVIVAVGIEAATADDDADSLVKDGGVDRVMSAE